MIHVKVAVKDYKDQDVQYVELDAKEAVDAIEALPLTSLTDKQCWAIKSPSAPCVQQVMEQVPGTEVKVFNRVPFLMSPKALEFIPFQDRFSDVVLLTFRTPGQLFVIMAHMKGKHFWHLPWCPSGDHALPTFLQEGLNVRRPSRPLGSWKVMRSHHKVIDFKTFIHFKLHHVPLELTDLALLFVHCGVDVGQVNIVGPTEPQVLQCAEGNKLFHSLLLVPLSCLDHLRGLLQEVHVDQFHVRAVKVAFGLVPFCRRYRVNKINF